MKSIIALVVLLGCSLVQAGQSHCSVQEETLFSCGTGKKTISVCAAKNAGSQAEYRFGKLGELEMVVPLQEKRQKLDAGNFLSGNGGTGGFLRFRKNDFGYVVYWSLTRGDWNKDGTRGWVYLGGVVVEQKGKKLANVKCGKMSSGDVDSIEPDVLYKKLGFPANEEMEGFDIP